MRYCNWESECIAIVYSFARIFRAMSCKAMRIKLLRRPVGLTTTPRFAHRELFLVLLFSTPVVGFRPQMILAFILSIRAEMEAQDHPSAPKLKELLNRLTEMIKPMRAEILEGTARPD